MCYFICFSGQMCVQCLSLCFSVIPFVLQSLCTPTFLPHIKAIYQTHSVGQRQADLLVSLFSVCEFYDWGHGPGTHRYISDKLSLWLLQFLPLSVPFHTAWPVWIARPHVKATFDFNSWVPGDVAGNSDQLLQCFSGGLKNVILFTDPESLRQLLRFGHTWCISHKYNKA